MSGEENKGVWEDSKEDSKEQVTSKEKHRGAQFTGVPGYVQLFFLFFSYFLLFFSSRCFFCEFSFFSNIFLIFFCWPVAHKKETHQVLEFSVQRLGLWKIYKIFKKRAETSELR